MVTFQVRLDTEYREHCTGIFPSMQAVPETDFHSAPLGVLQIDQLGRFLPSIWFVKGKAFTVNARPPVT